MRVSVRPTQNRESRERKPDRTLVKQVRTSFPIG